MNKKYFIRFGEIPKSGKSKNFLTDNLELGISVYDCIRKDKEYLIIMPKLTYSNCVGLSGCIDRDIIYLVTGNIIGRGSDTEPLLSNYKIVKKLKLKNGVLTNE